MMDAKSWVAEKLRRCEIQSLPDFREHFRAYDCVYHRHRNLVIIAEPGFSRATLVFRGPDDATAFMIAEYAKYRSGCEGWSNAGGSVPSLLAEAPEPMEIRESVIYERVPQI